MTCAYPGGCQIPLTTRNGTPRKFKGDFCEVHYARLKRTGDLGPAGPLQHLTCEHPDGCDRHQKHGSVYCHMHHYRLKRHGDLGPAGELRPLGSTTTGPCQHPDGCEIPNPGRFIDNLCAAHWQRQNATGDLGPAGLLRIPSDHTCKHPDGCEIDTDRFVHGYCQHHAMRLKNSGDLGPPGLTVNASHLRDLPTSVYQCYDDLGTLLYVGIAAQLDARLNQHRLYSAWWDNTMLVTSYEEPTRNAAMITEKDAIKSLSPMHNVIHNA